MIRRLLWLVTVAAFLPLSAAGQNNDPGAAPPGIVPSTMTLARLMALHRIAVGRLNTAGPRTRVERWTYKSREMTGTQTLVQENGDFREDTILGPFHSAQGRYRGTQWQQNENGLVRTDSGIHQEDQIDARALEHATQSGSGVKMLGAIALPAPAYVVMVSPSGGRMEYVFYDQKTYLIVRSEKQVGDRRVVTTYDDFRTTFGVREAWHVHRANGLAHDETDWQLQSLRIGATIDPSTLVIPPSRPIFALNGADVKLPAKVSGDRVILTLKMSGHEVNVQLDSGASGILLDRSVADATNVRSYGTSTEETAGKYLTSSALVAAMQLGSISLTNVAAETVPFRTSTYDGTLVAGLLGYDFIANCVVRIDYMNATVDAIDPATFAPPNGAVALPIQLDDGVPAVSVRIGNTTGEHFIVDTGADRSMIFSSFANAHPDAVVDQGLGEEMIDSFPFVDRINGVGGKVTVHPVQVKSLTIGSVTLPKWLFSVSQDAPSFEGEDYDGLIGQDVLRNFDVYLDYPQLRIYLVPNDRYRQRWGN